MFKPGDKVKRIKNLHFHAWADFVSNSGGDPDGEYTVYVVYEGSLDNLTIVLNEIRNASWDAKQFELATNQSITESKQMDLT